MGFPSHKQTPDSFTKLAELERHFLEEKRTENRRKFMPDRTTSTQPSLPMKRKKINDKDDDDYARPFKEPCLLEASSRMVLSTWKGRQVKAEELYSSSDEAIGGDSEHASAEASSFVLVAKTQDNGFATGPKRAPDITNSDEDHPQSTGVLSPEDANVGPVDSSCTVLVDKEQATPLVLERPTLERCPTTSGPASLSLSNSVASDVATYRYNSSGASVTSTTPPNASPQGSPSPVGGYGQLSLAELQARKKELKQQLKQYKMNFFRQHRRMPVKSEKEPIRHLYENYNALKSQIHKRESNAIEQPSSRVVQPVLDAESAAGVSSALISGLASLKAEKKLLYQMLRSYEKDFFREHKRQVSSFADIQPVASQYRRHKKIEKAIANFEQQQESQPKDSPPLSKIVTLADPTALDTESSIDLRDSESNMIELSFTDDPPEIDESTSILQVANKNTSTYTERTKTNQEAEGYAPANEESSLAFRAQQADTPQSLGHDGGDPIPTITGNQTSDSEHMEGIVEARKDEHKVISDADETRTIENELVEGVETPSSIEAGEPVLRQEQGGSWWDFRVWIWIAIFVAKVVLPSLQSIAAEASEKVSTNASLLKALEALGSSAYRMATAVCWTVVAAITGAITIVIFPLQLMYNGEFLDACILFAFVLVMLRFFRSSRATKGQVE